MDNKKFAQKLTSLRKEKGLTQSDIAEKLLPSDKAVDGNHIVGAVGIDRTGGNLEIHKGVMVAQHQIRRHEAFGTVTADDRLMPDRIRRA